MRWLHVNVSVAMCFFKRRNRDFAFGIVAALVYRKLKVCCGRMAIRKSTVYFWHSFSLGLQIGYVPLGLID